LTSLGVYVHFPWCRARCPYCDFAIAVAPLGEIPHRRYADAILDELAAADPGRRVQRAVQPDLVAEGDPDLLRIALANLLGNAWKFSAGRRTARIEVGRDGGDGAFFVRDNGAGFDLAHAGRLFEPFQRLHSSEEFEGTGIGLALVLRIVQRHHGRVWAEAQPGQGATFRFTLGALPE
jgi:light-regulated signal transduction histidine kinase (bacteriophytochrome)